VPSTLPRRIRGDARCGGPGIDIGSEIRVHYTTEGGRPRVTRVQCGSAATVADLLRHEEIVKLVNRYNGVVGRLRELWDKLKSLAGVETPTPPFRAGSRAYESWLELRKLEAILAARYARLPKELGTESESLLRGDIEYLENEYRIHKQVVDDMIVGAGRGFVAKPGESTLNAAKAGWELPDIKNADGTLKKASAITEADVEKSDYFYRASDNGKEFTLVKKPTRDVPSLTASRKGEVTEFKEGNLTRHEAAQELIDSLPADKKAAFLKLRDAEAAKGNTVVPIQGMASAGGSIRKLAGAAGADIGALRTELFDIVIEALARKGADPKEAMLIARKKVDDLLDHELVVVRGTEQLRAFGYRANYMAKTGKATDQVDDLHHWIPLYLGGSHRLDNLIDMSTDLHKQLHDLIDRIRLGPGVSLAPTSIGKADLKFERGAAILYPDGGVELKPL
jgi:hypothetical protein